MSEQMQEGTTMAEWFIAKKSKGFGIAPDAGGTITIDRAEKLSVADAFLLHEELGKLIEGKIERTEDGLRYLI